MGNGPRSSPPHCYSLPHPSISSKKSRRQSTATQSPGSRCHACANLRGKNATTIHPNRTHSPLTVTDPCLPHCIHRLRQNISYLHSPPENLLVRMKNILDGDE
jgi:hypothetical protein